MKDALRRKRRDDRALANLVAGMPQTEVAARAKLSTVQLWRRVGKRFQALKAAGMVNPTAVESGRGLVCSA